MIRFSCGSCSAILRVPDEKAGVRGRCPVCGKPVVVPAAAPAAELGFAPEEPEAPKAPAPLRSLTAHPHIRSAESAAPRQAVAAQPSATAGAVRCPSCSAALPYNAKICVQCGIHVPGGRPLLTVRDVDLDALEINTEKVLKGVSWLVPFGLFPLYSEAMGKSRPYVTWAIAALTIIISVYAWTNEDFQVKWMLWGGNSHAAVQEIDDASPEELDSLHHSYQLLTHQLLHADIMHLAGNLVFLLVIGSRVNSMVGNIAMVVLYPVLGVAAAQAHLWASAANPVFPMLGASGAIMGLAGLYLVLFPIQKIYMAIWMRWGLLTGFRLTYKVFAVPGIAVVLFYIAFDVVYTVFKISSGTAHWAHMGGMMAGVALALLLLISRLLYCPGDLVSLALGRFAWPFLGTPASRQRKRR